MEQPTPAVYFVHRTLSALFVVKHGGELADPAIISILMLKGLNGRVIDGNLLNRTALEAMGVAWPSLLTDPEYRAPHAERVAELRSFVTALAKEGILAERAAVSVQDLPASFADDPESNEEGLVIIKGAISALHFEAPPSPLAAGAPRHVDPHAAPKDDGLPTPSLPSGVVEALPGSKEAADFNKYYERALDYSGRYEVPKAMEAFKKAFALGGNAVDYEAVVECYGKNKRRYPSEHALSCLQLSGYRFQEDHFEGAVEALVTYSAARPASGGVHLQNLLNSYILRVAAALEEVSVAPASEFARAQSKLRELKKRLRVVLKQCRQFYPQYYDSHLRAADRKALPKLAAGEVAQELDVILDYHVMDRFFLLPLVEEALKATAPHGNLLRWTPSLLQHSSMERWIATYDRERRGEENSEGLKMHVCVPVQSDGDRPFAVRSRKVVDFLAIIDKILSTNEFFNLPKKVAHYWETCVIQCFLSLPCERGAECLHHRDCPIYCAQTHCAAKIKYAQDPTAKKLHLSLLVKTSAAATARTLDVYSTAPGVTLEEAAELRSRTAAGLMRGS